MLVVIDIKTKEIMRIIVDNEEYKVIDFYNKGRILGEILDPVVSMTIVDGKNKLVFRKISDDEFKEGTYKFFKEVRDILVLTIEVTYNGNTYQGDEISQSRMSRAILSMTPEDTIRWKTADNKEVVLTRSDLSEILRLAGQEQTRLWFGY